MLKVTHLMPRDGIGGVESAARSMAEASGLKCDFQALFIGGEVFRKTSRSLSVSPHLSENSFLAHWRVLIQILRHTPNVLICSLWRSVPVGLLVMLFRPQMKLVYLLHSPKTSHVFDRLFGAAIMQVCDSVWADSSATMDSRGRKAKRSANRVISFVTEQVENVEVANRFEPRFVFWGRLSHQKGLDRAINFISMLIDRGCAANFEIWGPDDGAQNELTRLLKMKGIERSICFRGPVNRGQLGQLARENTFYLQLSREEGMAMAVVEAMQRGLVPIVSPVGEVARYCRHGSNAIVVKQADNPVESVDEVVSLLDDLMRYRDLQLAAIETWQGQKLYANDVDQAAREIFELQ